MSHPPDSAAAARLGPIQSTAALVLGALALASASARVYESSLVRGSPLGLAVFMGVVALLALATARLRGEPLPAIWWAAALAAIGVTIAGLPELPAYPSIDSFGRSPLFAFVNLAVLAFALAIVPGCTRRGGADDLLLLFAAFTAFGGPMFVRDAQEYHGHFLLLGAIVVLSAHQGGVGRRLRDVPFIWIATAFLLWSLACTATTVDVDRHLQGVARAATAFVPLLVLGTGAASVGRARAVLWAFAGVMIAGTLCAAITVLEAGYHFSLGLAKAARLPLFGAHPNIIAPYFSVGPPLLLALLAASKRLPARIVLLVALAGSLWALKLTQSRAALLGGGLSIVAFAGLWAAVAVWRKRPLASTVAALVLSVVVAGGAAGFVFRDKIAAKLTHPSMTFRVDMWKTATTAIEERPVAGYGYLTGSPLMSHAASSELDGRSKDTHPHMLVLAIAIGTGVPGAILFIVLVLAFLVRTLAAAGRFDRVEDRAVALGVVASALALIAANTIDQGLALNTPLPLHFGLLLGCGAVCIRAARAQRLPAEAAAESAAPPLPSRPFVIASSALALFLAVVAGGGLIASRMDEHASRFVRTLDLDTAVKWFELARAVNPYSLPIAMDHAETLDIIDGRREEAIAELWSTAATHPLAWQPWDRISTIQTDRHEEMLALQAVKNAQRRDPTGPVAAEWFLRSARLEVQLRQRESAVAELARAMQFDFKVAMSLPWQPDPATGEITWYLPPPLEAITLKSILEHNRRDLRGWLETDPVKARRMATVLARTYKDFKLYDDARSVIDEFESAKQLPWLPITFLKIELDAIAKSDPNTAAVAAASGSATAESYEGTDDPSRMKDLTTGLRYAEAKNCAAANDHAGAIKAAELGMRDIYDMVTEREYLRLLIDIAFESACSLGDRKLAERWFHPSLYFNTRAEARLAHHVRLAECFFADDDAEHALATLRDGADYFPRMQPPNSVGVAAANGAGHLLAKIIQKGGKPGDEGREWLSALGRHAPEHLLAAIACTDLGQTQDARFHVQSLRAADAAWFAESTKRNP